MKISEMIELLASYPPETMIQCVLLRGRRNSVDIMRDLSEYCDPAVTIMVHHAGHVDLEQFEKCMEGLNK